MGRDAFVNPATGETYTWPRNHNEEPSVVRSRHIEELPPAAMPWHTGLRPTRQQSTATPLVLSLKGNAPTEAMHRKLVAFFDLCTTQTIFFYHCDGPQYEVQITRYQPQRKRQADPHREKYTYDYTLDMEVVRVL